MADDNIGSPNHDAATTASRTAAFATISAIKPEDARVMASRDFAVTGGSGTVEGSYVPGLGYDRYSATGDTRLRRDALELAIKSGAFHDHGPRADHYLLTRAAAIAAYLQDGTVPTITGKPPEPATSPSPRSAPLPVPSDSLTDEDLNNMFNAIGRPADWNGGPDEMNRDHYCASVTSDTAARMRLLSYYWEEGTPIDSGNTAVFHLRARGIDALKARGWPKSS